MRFRGGGPTGSNNHARVVFAKSSIPSGCRRYRAPVKFIFMVKIPRVGKITGDGIFCSAYGVFLLLFAKLFGVVLKKLLYFKKNYFIFLGRSGKIVFQRFHSAKSLKILHP
jgi:hypothetical protein